MIKKENIDSLTGLRGIAALFVVITHYSVWVAPYNAGTVPHSLGWIFETSDLGLTIFFVLSGFVIFYNYESYPWDGSPIKSFFKFIYLRFCRLYPALILFYLTFLDKFSQVLQTADIKGILNFLGMHLIFAETLIPLKFEGALVGNTTFHVSWSLGTEFVMYIMFGLLMIIYFRSGNFFYRKLILVTIAAYAITLIYLAFHPPVVLAFFQKIASPKDMTDVEWYRYFFYLSPYFRFGNFLLGVGAAYLVVNQRKMLNEKSKVFNSISVVSFILLILIFVLDHRFGLFQHWGHAKAPLFQILNSCLIAAILMNATNKNIINKILETKVLVQVGIVSYSLYLFHYLVPRFGLTLYFNGVYHSNKLIVHFTNMALNMFVAVVLAFGFFKIVEAPGKKFLTGFLGKNKSNE